MSKYKKLRGGALVVPLLCIICSASTVQAARVGPADVPFNDPVVWWNPEYWNYTELPAAWATTLGSPSVTIAFVGTGVKPIDDLASNMVPGFNSWDNSGNTTDKVGHETMVASVSAAVANNGIGTIGVCPLCSIMPVRAAGPKGNVSYGSLASGIKKAVSNGARIIVVAYSADKDVSDPSFNRAVFYATSRGALVVIAAGNGTYTKGVSNRIGTNKPAANYLASDNPEALRVAAAWSPDNGQTIQLDPSSNYGKRLADVSAFGNPVPVDTIKDNNLNPGGSGTSMATAVVSGIAGLVLSRHPELKPAQLKAIIVNSCIKRDGFKKIPCGGVVSANRALLIAANPPKPMILRVKIQGKGKVMISGQPECARKCHYNLIPGTIRFVAKPGKNWRFVRWTGGISSKRVRLTVNIKAAKSIKAVFVKVKKRR